MAKFIIKQLPHDLSFHARLALIGKYLKRININSLIDPAFAVRSGVASSTILKSYLDLLCLGKNDFDAIENFRDNAFFMHALGLDMDLERLPSGKFDTNYLVCQLAAMAMNLLRLIGQNTLNGPVAVCRISPKGSHTGQKSLRADLLGVATELDGQIHEILCGYLKNSDR